MFWLKIILIAIPILAIVVYFGLPRALSAMGLHPHYDIPEFDLAGKRALVITTAMTRWEKPVRRPASSARK